MLTKLKPYKSRQWIKTRMLEVCGVLSMGYWEYTRVPFGRLCIMLIISNMWDSIPFYVLTRAISLVIWHVVPKFGHDDYITVQHSPAVGRTI